MKLIMAGWLAIVVAGAGCGKGKGAAADDKSAPPCSEAAAKFMDLENHGPQFPSELSRFNPNPDQVKTMTGLIEALCKDGTNNSGLNIKGWNAAARTCVVGATKSDDLMNDPLDKCWKDRGHTYAMQVLHVYIAAEKEAAAVGSAPATNN